MRKIDIAARVHHLEAMLHRKRASLAQQADERAELIEACRIAGDHVPEMVFEAGDADVSQRFFYACSFCHFRMSTSKEQVSRSLVVG